MSILSAAPSSRSRAGAPAANLLKAVPLAWPTLLVALLGLGGWLGAALAVMAAVLPMWAGVVIAAVAAFASFTPMHDASHRSVALRQRWLNGLVGRLAALPLMAPFAAFRYLHLEHHKHTNDEAHDPDMWSGSGPLWLLPLKWATQDFYYYVIYFRVIRERPRGEALEVVATLAALLGVAATLVATGHGLELLLLWFVPARLAYTALAWAFDYLPHRPHTVTSREDRFRATSILAERWLTPFFLWQNFHLIHHLYPGVPFYRYGRVWRARRAELVDKGARERSIFGRVGRS